MGQTGDDDAYAAILAAALDLEAALREQVVAEGRLAVAESEMARATERREAKEAQSRLIDRLIAQAEAVEAERKRVEQEREAGKLNPEGLGALRNILSNAGMVIRDSETPTLLTFLERTFIPERNLQEDANRHIQGYVRMFAKVLGDRPMGTYTRADIMRWVRTLEKVRTSYGKGGKDHTKPIDVILKESKGKPTLGVTTIEKHITHLQQVFLLAIRHHRFATADDVETMFGDVKLGRAVRQAEARKLWPAKDLTLLFRSPMWSGTRARQDAFAHRYQSGPHIHVDAYWWLPIIGLHMGMRLEEIAQLRHSDLRRDVDGRQFLNITDQGEGQRLKTKSSRRAVPVHPFLAELGFAELFVADRRGWVFPELIPAGRPPKRGGQYSEDFTAYRRQVGLYEPLKDFHSFRHTLVTQLREGGVDAGVVALMVGHQTDPSYSRWQQTDGYTKFSVQAYATALGLLDWEAAGVDMSYVRAAVRLLGCPRGTLRATDVERAVQESRAAHG